MDTRAAESNGPEPRTVALFPIPNMVAFPGTVVPLHVFEPRYRQLVQECVDAERMIGLCHTRKTIRAAKATQSLEEALSSNQATYLPHEIFSAGRCEVVETMADGRILINVHVTERLAVRDELQTLPYRIVSCDVVEDEAEDEDAAGDASGVLQRRINERLIELVGSDHPRVIERLSDPGWLSQSPAAFSFALFGFVRFDADLMQAVLESTRVEERLRIIWDVISA